VGQGIGHGLPPATALAPSMSTLHEIAAT